MHDNATMFQADLVLTRSSYNNDAVISFHSFDNSAWTESGLTMNSQDGSTAWTDGGRSNKEMAAIDAMWSNQTNSEFRVDLLTQTQVWLDTSSSTPLSIFSTVRGEYDQYSSSTNVEFYSSEDSSQSNLPYLELMYGWGSGTSPTAVELIDPADGVGVWTLNDHNLSGNTTPTLTWNGSEATSQSHDIIWQLSEGPEFRNITAEVNTVEDNDFTPGSGNYSLTGLDEGKTYAWRMQHVSFEGHHGEWTTNSFFVPSVTSTWLGGNDYQLTLSSGNSSVSGPDMPYCTDTYIDSGSPNDTYPDEGEIQVSYSTFSETAILFGCDMNSHFLPSGYAVSYANMRMKLSFHGGNPIVGAWDNTQSNWVAESANWNTFDGVNNWSQSGAKGSERGSLLSSNTLTSSFSSGDWVNWNITLNAQDAMRSDGSLDFIIGIVGAGSGGTRQALFDSSEQSTSSRPEVILVYSPGSNAKPNNPIPLSPANGSWSIIDGIEPAPDARPVLNWSYGTGVAVGGWSLQLDTTSTFDSGNLLSFASWNDNGFDLTNMSYTPQQDLSDGQIWHWRVRAVSTTNQLGDWSAFSHFLLPDITTWLIDSNTSAVEYHHHDALPSLHIPEFEDTWVKNSGANNGTSQGTDTVLKVGTLSDGSRATGMLRVPLSALPNPANAHVLKATLNLYPEWGSSESQHISIHSAMQAWNSSANGTTYDGVNNWSSAGGLGATDSGEMVDVNTIVGDSWAQYDVTELVQSATLTGNNHLSIMLIGDDASGLVTFTSVDSSSNRPWLNITWATGNSSQVTTTGSPNSPSAGSILWDTSSHALIPTTTPTLNWTHPNAGSVDDWRLFIWNNGSDEREGWTIHDTRESTTGFNIGALSWTSTSVQEAGRTYRWFVQPIIDDIYGPRSASLHYHLPAVMSGELNSTDAWLNVVEGSMVNDIAYPEVMSDTWINEGGQNLNYGNAANFTVGTSPSSSSLRSKALLEIDLSNLPIPQPFDVLEAELKLYRDGGQQSQMTVSISDLFLAFDENNATWNQADNGTNWSITGASGQLDSGLPVDIETITGSGWFSWDVSQLAQAALARGDQTMTLLIQSEEPLNASNSFHTFASSNNMNVELRPQLNLTLRSVNQWLPTDSSSLYPTNTQTMWNMSADLPSPMHDIVFSWNSTDTNATAQHFQMSSNPRFINPELFAMSNDSTTLDNGTFTNTGQRYSYNHSTDLMPIDEWIFWRVRTVQDYRIGNWSMVNKFRMPDFEGEDDGTGNLTLNLNRGTVFTNTSVLPLVPDTTLDSSSLSTNYGSSTALKLGAGASGSGEARILIEYDLNELPFPANMIPTSTILTLYRYGITGGQSLTVAAYPCSSFSESGASWNNAPTCSSSEITRTTLGVVPPTGYMEWDITSLAQSNIAAGNRTLTVMLAVIGTPGATHEFRSSEYSSVDERPNLIFDYVDNSQGITPPAQPTLLNPIDGDVLYDDSNWILQSATRPVLEWNAVANATDYILTIANATGQTKYRSWSTSGFGNSNFTLSTDLAAGESYEWWVQAVNGSIPGPSSSRWTFAIGNPINNTYNSDNTYTYQIRNGEEVPTIGHASMIDSVIDAATPNSALEDTNLMIGNDSNGDEKRSIIVLDPSQFPLPSAAKIHSASVGLYIENVRMNSGVLVTNMNISVHPIITSGYTPLGSTWNEVASGSSWSAAGLQPGVDYGAATGSTTLVATVGFEGWIWLDLSHSGLDLNNAHEFILIATGQAYLDISHSQDSDVAHRPIMLLNYTHIDHVTITPGNGASTDADTDLQYSYTMYDGNGTPISGVIEWGSTSGTIDSTGLFAPDQAGMWQVSACFGLVCDIVTLSVTSGSPTTWANVFTTDSGSYTIDADQGVDFTFTIYDQHGNVVSGQTVTATATNGSLTETSSGNTHSWHWDAWAVGAQTIEVNWGAQTHYQQITVVAGQPVLVTIGNCGDDDLNVPAGTTCAFDWDVFDSKGNDVAKSVLGLVTWTAEEHSGNVSQGNFTADKIGTWQVNLTSAFGLDANTTVTVIHGEIDYLEIIPSSLFVTADDLLYLNTTRVDIRGNRLMVDLPAENWTVINGWLTPGSNGSPAIWEPETVGSKILRGNYGTEQTELIIAVSHGIISQMEIDITTPTNMTADDQSLLKSYGVDNKGNRWSVNVEWMISQDPSNTNDWLHGYISGEEESTVIFKPTYVGEYSIRAIYTESSSALNFMISTNYSITHGQLADISFTAPNACTSGPDDDPHWTNDCVWEMTADENIPFAVELVDLNGNQISDEILTWTENGNDVSSDMVDDSFVWSGVRDEGEYVIRIANGTIFEEITVNIRHGRALVVNHVASANSVEAGQSLTIKLTGTDVAGNTFDQDVTWSHPTETVDKIGVGEYIYNSTMQGTYDLVYELPGAQTDMWTITVAHTDLSRFVLELDKISLEQQAEVTITISAFDRFGNPVAVPTGDALIVEATGRGTVSSVSDDTTKYKIETLDEGEHTITVTTLVAGIMVTSQSTYNVTGTLPGFFASGGPLYYVAGGLGTFVILVLFVLVVVLFRRSTTGYDDEDDWDGDDEDEDYLEEDKEQPEIPETEETSTSESSDGVEGDDSYRVDDDGTEWWEDEAGVWWFKETGAEDWQEWNE
ncbi:MAG: DNRLRE domain-containing protein [Candidatus Poseidoniaceae archaeon]|nr:DNRLRE domain-containing protein [Candidatus Poseidoniaceae archaeon]